MATVSNGFLWISAGEMEPFGGAAKNNNGNYLTVDLDALNEGVRCSAHLPSSKTPRNATATLVYIAQATVPSDGGILLNTSAAGAGELYDSYNIGGLALDKGAKVIKKIYHTDLSPYFALMDPLESIGIRITATQSGTELPPDIGLLGIYLKW